MKQVMDYIMATKLKGYTVECLQDYYEDDPADVKKCTLITFERSKDGKKSCTNTKEVQVIEAFPVKSLKEIVRYSE